MNQTVRDWHRAADRWEPPADWQKIQTIDAHTAGEPLRIIFGGLPSVAAADVLAARRYVRDNLDVYRRILMGEPRGHSDMYGCIILPPESPDADFGVLFLHNDGYSSMCGHGIIAVTRAVLETGFIQPVEPTTRVVINAPAGKIVASATVRNGLIGPVEFENVASFVVGLDQEIVVEDCGPIVYDLAFGGAYYAYVNLAKNDLDLELDRRDVGPLIRSGMAIKHAVANAVDIRHPVSDDLSFLYGTIFVDRPHDPSNHSRNVCIFAAGEVDRSPTGTGVSGRAAIEMARGNLSIGQSISIESILGTVFSVAVKCETKVQDQAAIVPIVSGDAYLTGRHEFWVDPRDPMGEGFFVR